MIRTDASGLVVIGLGTGRCGTVSLSKLLSAQAGVLVTHEAAPLLPWEVDRVKLERHVPYIQGWLDKGCSVAGDVAYFWLPYVPLFDEVFSRWKAVGLIRDRDEVVHSFLRKTTQRNHWQIHDGSTWKLDAVYDPTFPKLPDTFRRRRRWGSTGTSTMSSWLANSRATRGRFGCSQLTS